jgi:uncharacterized protein YdeI (YjbR/CyaY-like superfamily)
MRRCETAEDWYADCTSWRAEVAALRAIAREAGLGETLKWMHPCYTDRGRNVLIIGVRKEHAVASFLSGALIDEPQGRFIQPGQDRSVRYLAYTGAAEIEADTAYLRDLLAKAVDVARSGLRVERLPDEFEYVEELQEYLDADPSFRAAFEALTPGRRRGYNLHFGQVDRPATRVARIERCTERILGGKGLRDCVCGHSQRPPGCDGTHKHFS